MQKRISFYEFQSVKAVAKAIEPFQKKEKTLSPRLEKAKEELLKKQEEVSRLTQELQQTQKNIQDYESGVVNNIGFHTDQLVRKITETTEKAGKPVSTSKYVPTSIVTYDDTTKQYIITIPDEQPAEETVTVY